NDLTRRKIIARNGLSGTPFFIDPAMKIRGTDRLLIAIVILGIISIILENVAVKGHLVRALSHGLDTTISILFVSEIVVNFFRDKQRSTFIKRHPLEIVFVAVFLIIFVYGKYYYFFIRPHAGHNFPVKLIIAISVLNIFKVFTRIKRLNYFLQTLSLHPAQTIMFSFLGIILAGTIFLMMPISTPDHSRIGFINSLFTATSATCVTGLVVLDTATKFSHFGKIVIMFLIQAGGLGIMLFAFFAAFVIRKKLSFEERLTASYMLEETDVRTLAWGVKAILTITFLFELFGAILLFLAFKGPVGGYVKTAFFSVFHSVSAFCNAGFALFSDNLGQFKTSVPVNFVVAGLIIAGGISFGVLGNSYLHLRSRFRKRFINRNQKLFKMNLNARIVLVGTIILIVAGTLLIYKFEHRSILPSDIGDQYLMSFFQSVTLRTAGFNTMDISKLHAATYSLMILFMFIGGASGSCAGGVKVNTVGVLWAYVRSIFNNREDVVLFKHSIPKDLINQAFLVVLLSLIVVFMGALILTLTESKKFVRVVFEAVSAFGTVGLTTGITQELSGLGKFVITGLMFIGRLGPLTVITALAQRGRYCEIRYPEGRVSIG
ncbi:MAG: TrkH family potassium uptake protein, partial [Candidatus Omnitrophota bacterium]|nr:TrkH family potassium uptake protein [Candidatus Omnitrophota bacterium]